MKKEKSILTYFQEGFALANKSIVVYIIGLLLSIAPFIWGALFPNSSISIFSSVLSIIVLLITFGFYYSWPLFLKKQQHNSLDANVMLQVTMKNTKRLILPLLLLVIIFIVIFIFFVLATYISLSGNKEQLSLFLKSMSSGGFWSVIGILLLFVIEFVTFFAVILFSIEDKGFFKSIKESVGISNKHISFVIPLVGVSVITYLLTKAVFPGKQLWEETATSAITHYVGIIVSATTLIYYQKVIKK